jgi:hypothetical protein
MNVAYERNIVFKEIKEGLYRPFIYFFTKAIFVIPMMIYTTLFFTLGTYYIADLNQEESYKVPNTIIISIMTYTIGFLVGLLAGAMSFTPIIALPLVTTISNYFMLLGGYLSDPESPSDCINWLRFLTPFYYLRRALLKNEFDDLNIDDDVEFDPEHRYNYSGDVSENILMSLIHIFVLALLALYLLNLQ